MKKLFISLGVALGLLASTATQAQTAETTQKPFVFPTEAYQVTTGTGTFTDISSADGVVAIGADLSAKTDLKNMMIMKRKLMKVNVTDTAYPSSPALVVNAQADRNNKFEVAFPIGFDFKLSGKTMKYFVISALGGIFFSEDSLQYAYQSANTVAGENCIAVHPYITKKGGSSPSMPGANTKFITNKSGQPIAYYLTSGEAGQRILTVQHHYLVTGDTATAEADRDEWIFQFKCYEATNNIDFTVKKLEATHALGTTPMHKLLFGFVETSYAGSIYDPLGSKNMNIVTEPSSLTHKLYLGQTPAVNTARGWDSVIVASAGTTNQLIINSTSPAEGHTISLVYPAGGTTPSKYTKDDFIINETLNGLQYSATVQLKTDLFENYLEAIHCGTIVAVLSKTETPQYTFENGTFYGKDHQFEDGSTILGNAWPKFDKVSKPAEGAKNFTDAKKPWTISASNLSTSTTYYVHLYRMTYPYANAPLYSELCHTLSFTTAMDAPKSLTAGLPTLNSVDLTVTPDGNSEAIIIKSNTLDNLPHLSGQLKKGDSIKVGLNGEAIKAVVADIVSGGTCTIPLAENEGCYLVAYSINRTNEEAYAYSQMYLSVSVRAAYPTLPGLIDFANEPYMMPDLNDPAWEQLSKTTFKPLPFGWTRETEVATTQRGQAFGTGKPNYDKHLRTYLYAGNNGKEFDVVTPVFVCDKERVLATFNMTQLQTENETETVMGQPDNNDSIFIEYAIEDGEWIRGARFLGSELSETNPEGYYPLECKIEDEGIQGKRMRIRYRYCGATASTKNFNALPSIEIKEAKLCDKPRGIAQTEALTTDRKAVITWTDDNYPAATAFNVYYKPAGDETDNWQNLSVKAPEATIDGLNANTTYTVYISASCGRDGDSDDSYPSAFSTLVDFPYMDSMKQAPNYTVIIDGKPIIRKGDGPFKRGWTTAQASSALAAAEEGQPAPAAKLTFVEPTDPTAFMPDAGYAALANNDLPTSVGIRETAKNAWLLAPVVYIEEYGQNYPLNIQFKANSAQQVETDGVKTWVKGNIPDRYTDAVLYVLVSQNGQFTINDTIATIPISGQTIEDQTYSFDMATGIEGQAQVAFYVRNPKGTDAEDAPMMLFEIYDVAFSYVGTPCFPLTDLERTNTTTEQATFTWNGNNAIEYVVSWDLNSAEGYAHSATVTEPTYTITGLNDYTRYKVEVVGYCDAEHTQISPVRLTASFTTLQACHTPLNFEVTDITATGATFISATDQPELMPKRLIYVTPEQGGETQVFEQLNDTLVVTEKFAELTAYVASTQAVCGTDSSAMSESKPFTTSAKPIVKDSFNVVLNVTPENAGTVTGAGRYEEGADVTISATAAANYQFVAWVKENDTLSKEASYTFKMPAEALTYTALFVEKQANESLLKAAFNVMTQNGQLHIRNLKGLTVEEVAVYDLTGKLTNRFPLNSREDLALPIDAQNALLLVRIATEQGVTVYKVYLH